MTAPQPAPDAPRSAASHGFGHLCTLALVGALTGLPTDALPAESRPATGSANPCGGAFGLRIVSDSTPDWSSRENFVRSALSGWPTDHEKALAQFRWSYHGRRVGPYAHEDGRPVMDPILFFNSYGLTFCSMISAMNVALWETAGYEGRVVGVFEHVVAEVKYGGAWHLFDNDFCNYFIDEDGQVASGEALFNNRVRQAGKYYLFDHCPMASCRDGRITMGPSSWALPSVAKDWYQRYSPRLDCSCAQAGSRYLLGVRQNETYARYFAPIGYGKAYSRPIKERDVAAEQGSSLRNSRANGRWKWTPDLSDPAALFAARNVTSDERGLTAGPADAAGEAVFRVMAANVVTSARIRATPDKATAAAPPSFAVSKTHGARWIPVTAARQDDGALALDLTDAVAGKQEYLLKVVLPSGGRLASIHFDTVTQLNQRVLPALRLGTNTIVVVSDEHLETVVFSPWLSDRFRKDEFARESGWREVAHKRDQLPTIETDGHAELVLATTTPRPIRRIRMACTAHLPTAPGQLAMDISVDGGQHWKTLRVDPAPGIPYDIRPAALTEDLPDDLHAVQLRYRCDGAKNGLVNIAAEVGYEPAGARCPTDIVYAWEEYRNGGWIARTHRERASGTRHQYQLVVGGSRPPRLTSITVEPAGTERVGYGDTLSGVPARLPADYVLQHGVNLAQGRPYTVSRTASTAFPDTTGQVLTDGYIGLASLWGLGNINLTGKKNTERVGELVVWEPGDDLDVTVDLGAVQPVAGFVVCAVQPNREVRYPSRMRVLLSTDGKQFSEAGSAPWEDCFFPPADALPWEGTDSPLYAELPAGGILDTRFNILLEAPTPARYVRFRMELPATPPGGVGFWELQVFDRIAKRPWRERLVLP
jgi:hypothetical protein